MNVDCVPCLGRAAREVLAPRRAIRVALLGDPAPFTQDIHLLVEFSREAGAILLSDWLSLQVELRRRCGCAVELVSVNSLEERVESGVVALTILYDASLDG